MNGILIAILLTSAAPSFEATTLDGRTVVGPIKELTPQRLTIARNGPDVDSDGKAADDLAEEEARTRRGRFRHRCGTDRRIRNPRERVRRPRNQARITLPAMRLSSPDEHCANCALRAIEAIRCSRNGRDDDMKSDADLLIVRSGDGSTTQGFARRDADTIRFDLTAKSWR